MTPEQRLEAAKARRDAAEEALRTAPFGPIWVEYQRARLAAEREIAALRNEEHAVPLPFPVRWDPNTPNPHLLTSDLRTFLLLLVADPKLFGGDTQGDVNHRSRGPEQIAIVEFKHCVSAKLGSPNDEVLHGHPLEGMGLEPYRAQRVENSRWLSQIEKMNSVHDAYRPERWRTKKHYIFWFNDSTFECIAEEFD